jgi:hypothetical protein
MTTREVNQDQPSPEDQPEKSERDFEVGCSDFIARSAVWYALRICEDVWEDESQEEDGKEGKDPESRFLEYRVPEERGPSPEESRAFCNYVRGVKRVLDAAQYLVNCSPESDSKKDEFSLTSLKSKVKRDDLIQDAYHLSKSLVMYARYSAVKAQDFNLGLEESNIYRDFAEGVEGAIEIALKLAHDIDCHREE